MSARVCIFLTVSLSALLLAATGGAASAQTVSVSDVVKPEPPDPAFSSDALVPVVLSAPSMNTVTVSFTTSDGTALQPDDYVSTSGEVVFQAGETEKFIRPPVLNDAVDEANETFTVTLVSATNATIGDSTATVTIVDNDGPQISVSDATVDPEGTGGTKDATVAVSLSAASPEDVSVNLATTDDTAVAPTDYSERDLTVTVPAGETEVDVTIPIVTDATDEDDEGFGVGLSNPVRGTLSDFLGTVAIVDDDGPPTISLSDQSVAEGNAGTTTAVFTVSLSAPSSRTVTVQYASADGTATQPGDYAAASGTLTFQPGESTKTVGIEVVGDNDVEPDEAFAVSLAAPTNATLGDGIAIGTIIDDDTGVVPPVVPLISIADAAIVEGDAGDRTLLFTVTLSSGTTREVTVRFATANGTAVAPSDYAAVSGTVTFAPGETAKTVAVQIRGDTRTESTEEFQLRLSDPVNGTLQVAQATGAISDDDPAAPSSKVPKRIKQDRLFCGRNARGRCTGLKVETTIGGPGRVEWRLDAFNRNPRARASLVRLGKTTRTVTKAGMVRIDFRLRGATADRLLKRVRPRRTRLRVTVTFVSTTGKTLTEIRELRLVLKR